MLGRLRGVDEWKPGAVGRRRARSHGGIVGARVGPVRDAENLGVVRGESQALGPRAEVEDPDVTAAVADDEFLSVGARGDASETVAARARDGALVSDRARLLLDLTERGGLARRVGRGVHGRHRGGYAANAF